MKIIKSTWRWVLSAAVVAGTAVGGAIMWVGSLATTGTAVQTIVATGTAVTATAVFTLSFSDKSNSFAEYWGAASRFLASGRHVEIESMNEDITSHINARLDRLNLAATGEHLAVGRDGEALSQEEILLLIRHNSFTDKAFELLNYDLQYSSGQITGEELIELYQRYFDEMPDQSESMVRYMFKLQDKEFTFKKNALLRQMDLPRGIRGALAEWYLANKSDEYKMTAYDVIKIYDDLLAYAADTDVAPSILSSYIMALDDRGKLDEANLILDTYILLFADSDLGKAAAELRIANAREGLARYEAVIDITERNRGTTVADHIWPYYLQALAHRHEYAKAIRMADRDRLLAQVETPEQAAKVIYTLIKQIIDDRPDPITRANGERVEVGRRGDIVLTQLEICSGLATGIMSAGEALVAANLLFIALEDEESLPIHLMYEHPIGNCQDLADPLDRYSAESLALYLQALVEIERNNLIDANRAMSWLRVNAPDSLRPYVLSYFIKLDIDHARYQSAAVNISEALRLMPESPVLLRWQAEIKEGQKAEQIRSTIKIQ